MNFTRPTLVTITAPTCSGKSYLLNKLTDRGHFNRIVSTTTRVKRAGETEGVDYYFIDQTSSLEMERNGMFFELITFNGTRYGVTNDEMDAKMTQSVAPVVILEPQGLEIYQQKCAEQGWDVFKIYVHVTEEVRTNRLLQRGLDELWSLVDYVGGNQSMAIRSKAIQEVSTEQAKKKAASILKEQHRRLTSILGDERRWSNVSSWDAIVPGDDDEKAIEMIQQGVKWRNRLTAEPQTFGGRITIS